LPLRSRNLINSGAPTVHVSPIFTKIEMNTPANFNCFIKNSNGEQVSWLLNGLEIPPNYGVIEPLQNGSKLTISNPDVSKVGYIQCRLRSFAGEFLAVAKFEVETSDSGLIPLNLISERISNNAVKLTWNGKSDANFIISKRLENRQAELSQVQNNTELILLDLLPGRYFFKVSKSSIFDAKVATTFSDEISDVIADKAVKIENISANSESKLPLINDFKVNVGNSVSFSWTMKPEFVQYGILIKGNFEKIYTANESPFEIKKFPLGSKLSAVIYGITASGESGGQSQETNFEMKILKPNQAVKNFEVVRQSANTVRLKWNPLSLKNWRGHQKYYIIRYRLQSSRKRNWSEIKVNSYKNTIDIQNLSGKAFIFQIFPRNRAGDGPVNEKTLQQLPFLKESIAESEIPYIKVLIAQPLSSNSFGLIWVFSNSTADINSVEINYGVSG
jgi:hypothetical protein